MKGIILAGGRGTRLYPNTNVISKQILPVFDKPMIYYPLSVLMLAGIRDIAIVSTPRDLPLFSNLLGDGSRIGINLNFIEQKEPEGLAHGISISKKFIENDSLCYILGDNIFYGQSFSDTLLKSASLKSGAIIYTYEVLDPSRFGIIEVDNQGKPIEIVEKPKNPKSNLAVTGLYFYDNSVVDYVETLKPSSRGELEITDLNNELIRKNKLEIMELGRGSVWLDAGSPDDLLSASEFVKIIENRSGFEIANLHEINK